MAIDLNDEILQDFLLEAGEILDALGEQLVDLEQSPDDLDLLNGIFRSFHTVKGGAGFLAIDPLVNVCHKAEDVFNVLRQGERSVTPELMDAILQVVDVVTDMFDQIRAGNDPEEADPALLETLLKFTKPEAAAEDAPVETPAETATEQSQAEEASIADPENVADVVEQEFESMLDVAAGATEANSADGNDEITEEEFESLLDSLHGKGQFSTENLNDSENSAKEMQQQLSDSDEITEEEFEKVLDELHGKGKFKPEVVKPSEPVKSEKPEETPKVEKPAKTSKPQQTQAADSKPAKAAPAAKAAKPAPQVETTVRVDTEVLDEIMNMVGELVLVRNRFQTLNANSGSNEDFSKAVSNLDVVTADLQLSVMKTRMQPIKKVFGRFPRVVRDLARSLKKEIRLEMVGEDTDLDKNLVEALADPLVHLVRNAVDHGIESPEERVAVGKPREGLVVLTASQEGDHILLSIKDDGKGMNPDALRNKVVEKGLMDEESAARLDDKECYNLIFLPGFSTKTEISDVSGRGVGMDVVKTRITQMNGVVEIDSEEGVGSTIIIKVPLTLAIMPTLMVVLGGQNFALPLASVLEILDLDLRNTNVVDGQQVVMVREKALPLFYLSEWLVNDPDYVLNKKTEAGHVVVVNAGGRQIGFVVDQLIGQEEVVIKPLGAKLHGLDGLSGATITGDGKIALILDVPGLMTKYAA